MPADMGLKSIPFNAGLMAFIIFSRRPFLASLFQSYPINSVNYTYVGAAYILWLAWKLIPANPHEEGIKNKINIYGDYFFSL